MFVGKNYISDILTTSVKTDNGENRSIKWYQFRVPIYQPDQVVGSIRDFKSIRFMRLAFTDFSQPIVFRFATFGLIRGEWRRYNFSLQEPGEYIPNDETDETFIVIKGNLIIEFRDTKVNLGPGEMFVVKKGTEHRPIANEECEIMLIEPKGVLNTGNKRNEYTKDNDIWI